jgi:hypothetical protein
MWRRGEVGVDEILSAKIYIFLVNQISELN